MQLYPFAIPLTTRFRSTTLREGVALHHNGRWAEFSPFPEYSAREASAWARAAAAQLSTAAFPVYREKIPINCIVPAVSAQKAHALVSSTSCTTAKVKLGAPGDSAAAEEARLEAVRDALGPHGALRIDLNGAWDVETAIRRLRSLSRYRLEYVEQPVPSVEELAALRRRIDVPVAADESIRRSDDPLRVVRAEAADILVLKVQPLGGVQACLNIADACDLPIVVSSAVETSLGLHAGLQLAASLPVLPYACGLGTLPLLSHDIVDDPLYIEEGAISLREVHASREKLRSVGATRESSQWWVQHYHSSASYRE